MKPFVAIVGRPNVGKSTLFNRLVGRHLAIVEDVPGVTRDRHYADADAEGKPFTAVDTGGFVPDEEDELLASVREQAQLAVEECQVVVLVVDGRAGLTAADHEVAAFLRKSGKPVVLAVNKLDTPAMREAVAGEFYGLGFERLVPLSAEHGHGLGALSETLAPLLPDAPEEPQAPAPEEPIRLAVVGRPNVGKSTLINALLKQKRLVATAQPGTTRDPIDSELTVDGRRVILTDTAGIRRKRSIAQRLEKFAVLASLKVIERSDVAVLLMDATEPAVDQDAKIAAVAEERGRALVLVVNKWDLVEKDRRKEEAFRAALKYELKFVSYAPVIFTSALTGAKVRKVVEVALQLGDQLRHRASTPHLNRLLEQVQDAHPAPIAGGRPLRLYYIAQVGTSPPTFTITCNRPEAVPEAYKRYLNNQLRQTFDLKVPIRLH
ncbi:MAG TPA: ribosome biogenesis GTPase Der, partial [Myxococcaceae bacterium]|nr:ribosome biogenesis GTPase Der [Myxococcaceae bacterium]